MGLRSLRRPDLFRHPLGEPAMEHLARWVPRWRIAPGCQRAGRQAHLSPLYGARHGGAVLAWPVRRCACRALDRAGRQRGPALCAAHGLCECAGHCRPPPGSEDHRAVERTTSSAIGPDAVPMTARTRCPMALSRLGLPSNGLGHLKLEREALRRSTQSKAQSRVKESTDEELAA